MTNGHSAKTNLKSSIHEENKNARLASSRALNFVGETFVQILIANVILIRLLACAERRRLRRTGAAMHRRELQPRGLLRHAGLLRDRIADEVPQQSACHLRFYQVDHFLKF